MHILQSFVTSLQDPTFSALIGLHFVFLGLTFISSYWGSDPAICGLLEAHQFIDDCERRLMSCQQVLANAEDENANEYTQFHSAGIVDQQHEQVAMNTYNDNFARRCRDRRIELANLQTPELPLPRELASDEPPALPRFFAPEVEERVNPKAPRGRGSIAGIALLAILGAHTARAADVPAVVFCGLDASLSALGKKGNNPYREPFRLMVDSLRPGDRLFGTTITGAGLAAGTPPIDFQIPAFNMFTDRRASWELRVLRDRKRALQTLDDLLVNSPPARETSIIGFLLQASRLLNQFPKASRTLAVFSDFVEEDRDFANFVQNPLSDADITKLIESLKQRGALPNLQGVHVWFVQSTAFQQGYIGSAQAVRVELFWRKLITEAKGELKSYSPVLVNFVP